MHSAHALCARGLPQGLWRVPEFCNALMQAVRRQQHRGSVGAEHRRPLLRRQVRHRGRDRGAGGQGRTLWTSTSPWSNRALSAPPSRGTPICGLRNASTPVARWSGPSRPIMKPRSASTPARRSGQSDPPQRQDLPQGRPRLACWTAGAGRNARLARSRCGMTAPRRQRSARAVTPLILLGPRASGGG